MNCPETKRDCIRGCPAESLCKITAQKREKAGMELAAKDNYFIPEHRLGNMSTAVKHMLASNNKRVRRVDLNAIQHVLKTLQLIPQDTKVIALGMGCLDTGDEGLFILCASPHHLEVNLPEGDPK